MTVRILLVDDHQIVREGLAALIDREPTMEVVGAAVDGREAVTEARDLKPDLVLMDVAMPGLTGVEATRQIVSERPETRVLCLSMHVERRFVSAVLEAGAAGYLLKDCAQAELVEAIRQVIAGRSYLSPAVAATVVEDYAAHLSGEARAQASPLSGREREVLQLLAEGHSTARIAERLCLSPKTVGSHREHIMRKLGIDSIAGLTKYAIRHGLTGAERDSAA
jgi:DNA-binding NarL/FixJ family response regulator